MKNNILKRRNHSSKDVANLCLNILAKVTVWSKLSAQEEIGGVVGINQSKVGEKYLIFQNWKFR